MLNEIVNNDYISYLQDLPDNSVDCVITDPPYGINYRNNYTHKKQKVLKGDSSEFSLIYLGVELMRVCKEGCPIFIFTSWSTYGVHYSELKNLGFMVKEPIICQKRPSGTGDLYGSFQTNSDWILFCSKGRFEFRETELVLSKRVGTRPNLGRSPVPKFKFRLPSCWFGDSFPFSTENPSYLSKYGINHPTVKSVQFVEWLIKLSTEEGGVVLDPFCGSGTTALACKLTKRNFMCCDIDRDFCGLSIKRLKINR